MTWGPKRSWKRALAAGVAVSLLATTPALAGGTYARVATIMDSVFGRGAWRMTGGYRTPQRENELRAQGAKTVRPGGVSPHSLGSPSAPGAYDLVVDGMSPYEAAARLRRAGAPFARYQPKGAHGTQGPHLHLEPYSYDLLANAGPGRIVGVPGDAPSGLPVVLAGYRRTGQTPALSDPDEPDDTPSPATQALAKLRTMAMNDRPEAQLALGLAYAKGLNTPRDLAAARAWLELAAGNPKARPEAAQTAAAELDKVADLLAIEGELQTHRLKRQTAAAAPPKPCAPAARKAGNLPLVVAMGEECGAPQRSKGGPAIVVMSAGR
jgi:hypothetical protein